MGVEHREVVDASGRRWREIWRDGTKLELRELLPMAAQSARVRQEQALREPYEWWQLWKTTRAHIVATGGTGNSADDLALANQETVAFKAFWTAAQAWLAFGPVELPD